MIWNSTWNNLKMILINAWINNINSNIDRNTVISKTTINCNYYLSLVFITIISMTAVITITAFRAITAAFTEATVCSCATSWSVAHIKADANINLNINFTNTA